MATDVRLKEDLPNLTDEIVETYTTVKPDEPPESLPVAEI